MRSVVVRVSAAVLLAALGGGCAVIWRVESKLKDARAVVGREGEAAFTMGSWARPVQAGFEAVAPVNKFVAGAVFDGKLWLGGPGGIAISDTAGVGQPKMLRAGMEVPAAGVVALAHGRLRGEAAAVLVAATQGEGLLVFGGDAGAGVRQMRPVVEAYRDVTAVLPLASGEWLIGTRRAGLLVFDGRKLKVFGTQFGGAAVTSLAGEDGDLWVGTRTQGVLHWHAGVMDALGVSEGLPDAQVNDVAVSSAGVFVGTPRGVAEIRDGHVAQVLGRDLFVRALAVSGDTLQVATVDQGVRVIGIGGAHRHFAAGLPTAAQGRASGREDSSAVGRGEGFGAGGELAVQRFVVAGDSLLAVGDGGVMRLENGGRWETAIAAPQQALADGNVSALSFGADGRLWIGYFDRGVDVLDVASGRAQHVEDDHVFCVNRIVADKQRGTMDVATANGLVLFDGAAAKPVEKQVLSRRDGLISDQVTDVAFSGSGMTLATPAGLTMMTAGGPQSLYSFQGLANNHVYALAAEPGSGRVMAGTLAGVSIVDDGAVRQNVTLKNSGLKRNWITAIARVGDAGWFVGTYGGGVVAMDAKGEVAAMDGMAAGAVVNPNAMLVTERHVLVGTLNDGLLVYDRESRRWTKVTAGLPSRNVTAFAERDGEVYVGTENGIVRIAETELP